MVTHFEKTRKLPRAGEYSNNEIMNVKKRKERELMNEQFSKVLELSGYQTFRNFNKSTDFERGSSNSIHKSLALKSEIS